MNKSIKLSDFLFLLICISWTATQTATTTKQQLHNTKRYIEGRYREHDEQQGLQADDLNM